MRKSNSLTAVAVAKKKQPGRYADGGGLYLQVSRWRTRSWIFRFERDGIERQMGLGPVDIVSLSDARERARVARRLLLDGRDPIEVRRQERNALRIAAAKGVTFKQCADAFIEAHAPAWRNEKHRDQWSSTIERYADPIIGKLAIASIDTELVLKVLRPIWIEKTETANRLRGRIEQILDWAKTAGYREGENPARWRGHLQHMLADKKKITKRHHHPALPYAEISNFMVQLRGSNSESARALELLILTAARTSEVIHARWREIDFEKKLWTIPPERMKGNREHRVPLSVAALVILKARRGEPESYIFAGRGEGQPLSNMALLELMRDLRPGYVPHGFRSSFRDWAGNETSFDRETIELALAHVNKDKTEAAYRRDSAIEKRRLLMAEWAQHCERPQNPVGKIIRLRKRASA